MADQAKSNLLSFCMYFKYAERQAQLTRARVELLDERGQREKTVVKK